MPVSRKSLVDGVVENLRARILCGDMQPGEELPAEQALAAALGVSRTAVREALNRLGTARLVSMRHSGSKHVLDYRQSAGLELLPALVMDPQGELSARVVRSVLEMRTAVAADVARLAAQRTTTVLVGKLREVLRDMQAARGDLDALQDLVGMFWSRLVDGSDNVAYRLAYNSLHASYEASKHLLAQPLAAETGDVPAYAAITDAVARGDAVAAESLARALVQRGERSIKRLLRGIARPRRERRR